MHFKTTNLECAPSPKYFHNHSCRLKAINRYKTMAFMETYIKTTLQNVSVNVGLYSRNDANIYKPYLINFTANICKFMNRKTSGLYVNSLMRILKKYTNINHACPYSGFLIAKNIHADTEFLPIPPLLQNSYKFVFIFYEGFPYDYIGTIFSNGDLGFKTTKLECSTSPKYFYNHSCRLKAIDRYKSTAFMKCYIKTILKNISVNVGLYSRNDVNIYKPYLVNFTDNLCKYMDRKTSGLYINSLMRILKKYTNFNHSCPYTGFLIANNILADTSFLPIPPLLPQNSYKFVFIFFEGYPYDYIGTCYIYADMHLKTTKMECSPSPKYFYNHSCRLKAINRYKSLAFMKTYIKTTLKNVSINVGLYLRNDVNIYKPYLINFTSNLCKFMDGKTSGLYVNALKRILKKYTNIRHSCPYTGFIIANNISVDAEFFPLPPLVPQNSYKFVSIFYEGYPYDYMGTVVFYFDLIYT
ncbi:hypothetical protein CVS40_1782 [Lucilia cuprina]|nr:hypothetical protein CVS40_1782 [Lucilia cuprina]